VRAESLGQIANLEEAQSIIAELSAHQAPSVWVSDQVRRVLNPSLKLKEQILLLVGSLDRQATFQELCEWLEASQPTYVKRLLKAMHKERLLEFSNTTIELLPPGQLALQEILTREMEI
jgi:hypothetical protein